MAFNMAWHFALDLRDDSDAYFCERTLRNYRRKVVELGLDEQLFKLLTDRLVKAFNVDTSKQRIDSTALRSAMRSLTRLGCAVETICKFLRELKRAHPDFYGRVDAALLRRYVEREGSTCFSAANPSESKRRLSEAGGDLAKLYLDHRDTEAGKLPGFVLLARLLEEQFELLPNDDNNGGKQKVRVKEPAEMACDNMRNPSDPDSSYNTHRGQGYLAQIMETYQEDDAPGESEKEPRKPDLITHVAVGKMTVHDSKALAPALNDTQARGIRPEAVLGDAHYGSEENVKLAAESGTKLISPAMTPSGANEGRLTLEQFDLDEKGRIVKCPAGHAPLSASASDKKIQARFDAAICQNCPLKMSCPANSDMKRGKTKPRVSYAPSRVVLRQRRLSEKSDGFKKRYRWRAGIEGTMSRLKYQMGLGRLRVRGKKAVSYAVNMRALGLNILRCGACKTA
jgi:hypothetical protein